MADTVEAKAATKDRMPVLSDQLEAYAIAQANEFIEVGQSPGESASIVANLMIKAAWVVAASGAIADGRTPDENKFRACVENVFAMIQFRDPPVDIGEDRPNG